MTGPTDEEIDTAFYQTGGDSWQVIRYLDDDGQPGHAVYHPKYQPDPAAGDITVPGMLALARELLDLAEIAVTMGPRISQDGAIRGKGAAGRERGAC